ncbi:MAG: hypothetical protein LBK42_08710 [Propionibacteriaceae bacterium]|jgi:membrane protein implicated in regulation of membrane protease activity|nr:hypothetical protein [Propionibacteriaceae bacterium]
MTDNLGVWLGHHPLWLWLLAALLLVGLQLLRRDTIFTGLALAATATAVIAWAWPGHGYLYLVVFAGLALVVAWLWSRPAGPPRRSEPPSHSR